MAKRYQPLKEFGGSMKKPKLDVSINKGHPVASTSKATYANIPSVQKEPLQSVADFWDDDEDDVLLLATQVAESEIAASSKAKNDPSPMEITESEITFSEFEPKIRQHSTQQQHPQQLPSDLFFDEDDDDIVNLAAAIEKDAKTQTQYSEQIFEKEDGEVIFKKPALPHGTYIKSTNISEPGPSSRQETIPLSQETDSGDAARRQIASERQIKFLMERLDSLKEENSRLNKDLADVKDTMQTKTGETILLRNELRHTKQKLVELKMEKMFQTESVNVESKSKIEELSKKVQDKEAELELKNMECSVLKMRQADETKRLDTTARDETAPPLENEDDNSIDERFFMDMAALDITEPPLRVESTSILLTKDTFEHREEKGSLRKWNTLIQRELNNLQRLLAQVQLNPEEITSEISKQIIDSVRDVFFEFRTYVKALEFGFNETVLSEHEYDVLEDESDRQEGCLHLVTPLIKEERAINMRRYVAILAVICEKSTQMTHSLLAAIHEEKPLLQIAIDTINKLGFSLEVCSHFGILEAFSLLLRSMILQLQSDEESDEPFAKLLVSLLKELVFTRPSPWTLFELSYSVLDICQRFECVFPLFCVNSPRETFMLDRSESVYRFSNDSCLMQVYCGLLEAAFPLYIPLNETIFELQTKICLNHVRYVFYCVTDPPDFIDNILTADDDDDDETELGNAEKSSTWEFDASKKPYETFKDEQPTTSKNVTATSTKDNTAPTKTNTTADNSKSAIQCQCFEQLCLSAVRMVWLSLRQWQRFEKLLETERVGVISRVAVHLFHFLFCDNYLACLFREEEDLTKHFLYLICRWWEQNEKELQFSEIQANLFQKFKNSLVIPKIFHEEEAKLENIAVDLEQFCRATNEPFDPKSIDPERAIKNLRLMEDLADPEKFLAGLKEPNLDDESFEFVPFESI